MLNDLINNRRFQAALVAAVVVALLTAAFWSWRAAKERADAELATAEALAQRVAAKLAAEQANLENCEQGVKLYEASQKEELEKTERARKELDEMHQSEKDSAGDGQLAAALLGEVSRASEAGKLGLEKRRAVCEERRKVVQRLKVESSAATTHVAQLQR